MTTRRSIRNYSAVVLISMLPIAAIVIYRQHKSLTLPREPYDETTMKRSINIRSVALLVDGFEIGHRAWPKSLSEAAADESDLLSLEELVWTDLDFDHAAPADLRKQIETLLDNRYQYIIPDPSVALPDATKPSAINSSILVIEKNADSVGNRLCVTIDGRLYLMHPPR